MKTQFLVLLSLLVITPEIYAQTYKPNLQDKAQLSTGTRKPEHVEVKGKKGIRLEPGDDNTVMILNNVVFGSGTIEFDCKGRNLMGQSFLGVAFHIQNDSTYDVIYFRPFNFSNPDTVRRWRAVQYVSMPEYEWDKLREAFPGKYESKVNPVPGGDDWFHCKIAVKAGVVSVFVNNSAKPSLVVNKLTNTTKGKIGLWVESGSEGSFANLEIRNE